ncbi:Gfo/Idh/MocA family protein [Thermodesulfobacteriota bacterium]
MTEPMVAVVGCGYWGKNLARNFYQLGALKAICDMDPQILEVQGRLCPGVETGSDYEAVLAREDIAGVVIATPAEMHFKMVVQALEAGKDVFVEKPMALMYSEGDELVRLAEVKGRILMVGHVLLYHPAIVALKETVDAGEIGDVHYIYSTRLNLGKVRREENILWSFAPHDISIILLLLKELPISVSAHGGNYLQEAVTDVTVTTMEFTGGARGHIFVSWLHPYKEQKLVVVGSEKMAVFDDVERERKLRIMDKGIRWVNGQPEARQVSETTIYLPEAEPLRIECRHFLDCVRDRKAPTSDGRSALDVLKVLNASQTSMEQGGRLVDLKEEIV